MVKLRDLLPLIVRQRKEASKVRLEETDGSK